MLLNFIVKFGSSTFKLYEPFPYDDADNDDDNDVLSLFSLNLRNNPIQSKHQTPFHDIMYHTTVSKVSITLRMLSM